MGGGEARRWAVGPPAGAGREEVMEASWFGSLNRWGRRGVPRGSGTQLKPHDHLLLV